MSVLISNDCELTALVGLDKSMLKIWKMFGHAMLLPQINSNDYYQTTILIPHEDNPRATRNN